MDSAGWAAAFVTFGLIALAIAVGLTIIPGIIAQRKKHPYLVWIWLLATVGAWFTGGLGWIAALVWSLIPPQSSTSQQPAQFSPSSQPNSTMPAAETWSPRTKAKAAESSSVSSVEAELAELQRLLDTKQITQKEYDALRKKTLGI